jgi:heparan-alpha-glucosaminide N-acetyltransferase
MSAHAAPASTVVETRDAKPGSSPDSSALGARVHSVDAFRGFVMFLMLAEAMRLPSLARAFPGSTIASFLAFHTSHVEWQGCSLHDLIQPGFSFLVGAALPFSIASRRRKGQPFRIMLLHALWRSVVLVSLGIFLRSIGRPQTNFTFEDTLSQIGLGYTFLFLLGLTRVRVQAIALVVILVGYWGLFALFPAPAPAFDYAAVGVPPEWQHHHYSGFASHWNKNSNAAWAFDTWFLNLFPRERPFLFNRGGYSTLSFIPTLATMLLGLLAGGWLQSSRTARDKLRGLVIAGVALIAVALLWQWSGTGPIVKRIWTPSFALYSGGWVLLLLAGFYALIEWRGWKRWAFPLMVIGMNSIAIYVASWTMEGFIADALNRHLGRAVFSFAGAAFEPVMRGAVVVLILWLLLLWMHRRKIYLRI